MEVKTGTFGQVELRGLFEFTRRFPRYRPPLVCDEAELPVARRLGVEAVAWKRFLLEGPTSSE